MRVEYDILAMLMKQPMFAVDDKYLLSEYDFTSNAAKSIFKAIYHIAMSGFCKESISTTDIKALIENTSVTKSQYYSDQGDVILAEIAKVADSLSNLNGFDQIYTKLKRNSTIRLLKNSGFNLEKYFGGTSFDDAISSKYDNVTSKDLIDLIKKELQGIENLTLSTVNNKTSKAADGLRSLIERFKESPEIGLALDGSMLNSITRGARLGKMYMISMPTSHGKTRRLVGCACALAFPRVVDLNTIEFLNPEETLSKVLFIATEMDAEEIKTLILAWVSGVSEEKIITGTYNKMEEQKIIMALDIIEKYDNIVIDEISNPNIAILKSRITSFILHQNISYVFYDYIFNSPGLISEFRGSDISESVALMLLSNALKEIAKDYNIFLMTASQTSSNWTELGARNTNHLRGSKALGDKIDCGMVGVKLQDSEREKLEPLISALGIPAHMPNLVVDVYKNRRGALNGIKMVEHFDHATCRTEFLFLCTTDYSFLPESDDKNILLEFKSERKSWWEFCGKE